MTSQFNQHVREFNAQLEAARKEAARAEAAPLILVINTVDGHEPSQDEIREEVLRLLELRQ